MRWVCLWRVLATKNRLLIYPDALCWRALFCWAETQGQFTRGRHQWGGLAHLTGGLVWRWFTAFQYDEAAEEVVAGGREVDGGVDRT